MSALHFESYGATIFSGFAALTPEKFVNVTNGIRIGAGWCKVIPPWPPQSMVRLAAIGGAPQLGALAGQ